jgi:hypothetical protein
MDNSMFGDGRKVIDQLDILKPDRVSYPPYLQDMNPGDFWLSGMLEHEIKMRCFERLKKISHSKGRT